MAPTFLAMLHSLSLRMPMNRFVVWPRLLSASKEMPFVNAASPKCKQHFRRCRLCHAPPPCRARRKAPCPRGPRRSNRGGFRCAARSHSGRPSDGWCESGFAIGKNLVDINLVAHVPDKFVLRRVENAMQRDGQLHHSEIRAEMPATFGQPGDQLASNLPGQFLKLRQRELFTCAGPSTISR